MAVAAEDGGFEVVDCLSMVFASGFPKAHNISKAIDTASGTERDVVGTELQDVGIQGGSMHAGRNRQMEEIEVTQATHPLAQTFEGHRGGHPLKPATEFLYLFRKPYRDITSEELHERTGWDFWCSQRELTGEQINDRYKTNLDPDSLYRVVSRKSLREGTNSDILITPLDSPIKPDNGPEMAVRSKEYKPWATKSIAANVIMHWGAGAINIDGSRISGGWTWGTQTDITGGGYNNKRPSDGDILDYDIKSHLLGRWPANFIIHHLPGCKALGVKTVRNPSGSVGGDEPSEKTNNVYGRFAARYPYVALVDEEVLQWECARGCPVNHLDKLRDDEASPSRYFFQGDYLLDSAEKILRDRFQYITKPGRAEKDAGLDGLPLVSNKRLNDGGLSNEPRFAPTLVKNPHPTAKSIKLCKYIAGLLLPPRMYDEKGQPIPRRILVRFGGSGSEVVGCLLTGWDEVVVVELEEKYIPICQKRLEWWSAQIAKGLTDIDAILKKWNVQQRNKTEYEQGELF